MLSDCSLGRLFAGALLLLSSRAEAADAQEYVDHSFKAIETLNADWYNANTGIWDNAWWNSANTLTALADFTTLRLDEANQLNIGGYMRTTFVAAQRTSVQTIKTMKEGVVTSTYCLDYDAGCMAKRDFIGKRGFDNFINEYYDDEGWWALAWIRSHDAAGDQDFLEAAVDIFNDMQTGTGTPCGGGIFWNKDRKYVASIANELYLSVAASLARRIPDNGTYLEIAKSQWEWFSHSGLINDDHLINDGLDDNCNNNGLQTWSYNQGVILGGLTELALATGDGSYLTKAVTIAKAAIQKLVNDNGILEEIDSCELKDGHCGADGQQFKGVFVRNLRYLYEFAPEQEFKDFITKNADSIWANDRNDQNRLGVAWTGPYVDASGPSHSSALDVLVAAVAVA
ncbi:Fc.00g090610.m01.CDS01 [Cosmosporella sp. VM-42]